MVLKFVQPFKMCLRAPGAPHRASHQAIDGVHQVETRGAPRLTSPPLAQVNIPELSPLPHMGSGNTVSTPTTSTGGGGGGLKTTLHIPDMAADVAVTLGTPVKGGHRIGAATGHDSFPGNAPVLTAGPTLAYKQQSYSVFLLRGILKRLT